MEQIFPIHLNKKTKLERFKYSANKLGKIIHFWVKQKLSNADVNNEKEGVQKEINIVILTNGRIPKCLFMRWFDKLTMTINLHYFLFGHPLHINKINE